ncbi:hypothetical protein CKO15_00955 [Halorhodospira abdelmalekii]|uniref:GGDEF domain-containing protein n=1 Tax=Halorhodospira abdelmalekii TaxID=421629 RepID=UPI001908A582|nr:sensor domain-containing diguanylate cyclase [Halorhodospira abdelmalekii]MBK1733869.1 hypothetical protein [Halorhodospira abdelmalekii]
MAERDGVLDRDGVLGSLNQLKRGVYCLALFVGSLVLFSSWWMREPDDLFIQFVYPVFILLFLLFCGVLCYQRTLTQRFERLLLISAGALVFSRLIWHLHFAGPIEEHLLVLTGGHFWSVAVLLLAAYVVLEQWRGVIAGLLIIFASAVVTASGIWGEVRSGAVSGETLVYLLRVHLFLVIILALAATAATMRDKLQSALLRAELLHYWAKTDSLTGIGNRRAADALLAQADSLLKRYGRPFSLLLLDIDHFKRVNDRHGHAVGDQVIVEIARRLSETVRATDSVTRWGGEEFLIIAQESALAEAYALAERCRAGLAAEPMCGVEVTATFGVTEVGADETVDAALVRADSLLYAGKAAGRNRVMADAQTEGSSTTVPTTVTSAASSEP